MLTTASIISITHTESVPAGTYENCIVVRIVDPSKEGFLEYVLAPNVGLIKHRNTRTNFEYEMISAPTMN